MKPITRFQADDGRVFETESAALAHEQALRTIEATMGTRSAALDQGGANFVQHPHGTRERWRLACVAAGDPRLLDDTGSPWWQKGWYRVMCMDDLDREWGQPWFAKHPNPHARCVEVVL